MPQPPSPELAAEPPSKTLFWDEHRLRPFWALLIYLAILLPPVGFYLLAGHFAAAYPTQPPAAPNAVDRELSPVTELLTELALFAFVLFATWIMSRIEERSVLDYGFAYSPKRLRWLLSGAFLGLLFQSLLVLILWSTHHLVFTGFLLHPAAAVGYGLLWGLVFIAVAFFEEFLFRGYLQFNLTRCFAGLVRRVAPNNAHAEALGFWLAALLISFGFGVTHSFNPGESPIGLFCAGCAGLMFAFSLWRTGSLWWAIGLHAAWDWAQSFLFGVADSGGVSAHRLLSTHPIGSPLLSGGLTGPEGSLFVLPIMAAITVIAALTLPRNPTSFFDEPSHYNEAPLPNVAHSPNA